jgi:hypothetical protein
VALLAEQDPNLIVLDGIDEKQHAFFRHGSRTS